MDSNIFIFFIFLFIIWFVASQEDCFPLKTSNARIKSFLYTESTHTHTHTHIRAWARTSSDWQISLEIAYVIIASFGWIFISFSYGFQSLDSANVLDVRCLKCASGGSGFFCVGVSTFICASVRRAISRNSSMGLWCNASLVSSSGLPSTIHARRHSIQSSQILACWFLIKAPFRMHKHNVNGKWCVAAAHRLNPRKCMALTITGSGWADWAISHIKCLANWHFPTQNPLGKVRKTVAIESTTAANVRSR